MYMESPIGIDELNGCNMDYVMKLKRSTYGLEQASTNWFETLNLGWNSRDFEQSQRDSCVSLKNMQLFWCTLKTTL